MVVFLSFLILFSISNNSSFEEKVSKLFQFNKKFNIEQVKSKRHQGSYHISENKVYISEVNGKVSTEVLSHELTHFIFNNDEDYKIYNHFFYRELIPDIVSLEFKELKIGCEEVFSRKSYPHVTFDNFLEYSQGDIIRNKTRQCCDISDSDFCRNFKLSRNYNYYPKTVQFSISHYIGLPVLNFFNKMNNIEPNLIKKFLSHLKEEKSLFALDNFRDKITNKNDYDYYWNYYKIYKYKEVLKELNSTTNTSVSKR